MTTPRGPITLTPAQFARTPSAAKPGATYKGYLRFVNNRRANTPPADPYDPIIAGLPKPRTNQQTQQEAQGEIAPMVAAIVSAITKQTKGATSAISGYSNDAAAKLGAIDYGQPYQQGEGAQAAVDAALQQSLTGAGASGAQSLEQRLAVINDPSVAAAATNVAGTGAAAGTTELAHGGAALSDLIANAAAAKSYGQKLPGIQRAQGLQDIAGVEQTGQQQIAAGTQQAEGQLPSILSNLRGENDNRTSAIASARQNQLARNDNIAAGTAKTALDQAKIDERAAEVVAGNKIKVDTVNANNATRVQIANLNAQGRVTGQQLAQARSDRTFRLQFTRVNGYDPVTGRVAPGFAQKGGQIVKVGTSKPGSKTGGLTASQVQKYRGTAATIADNAKTGFTDPKGIEHPAISRQQALDEMRREGVPDQIALAEVNRVYGKPVSAKAAKTAVATPGWLGG